LHVRGRKSFRFPRSHRTRISPGAADYLHRQIYNKKVHFVANIKSQIKRIGTNKKSQDRNKAVKSEVKTAIRSVRAAVTAGDKDLAVATLLVAAKKLDKAASKGVIHKNQAANKKSAIAKQVAAL
jgi:small subunit ribosomal protein S20